MQSISCNVNNPKTDKEKKRITRDYNEKQINDNDIIILHLIYFNLNDNDNVKVFLFFECIVFI